MASEMDGRPVVVADYLQDQKSNNLSLNEGADMAQNHPIRRLGVW